MWIFKYSMNFPGRFFPRFIFPIIICISLFFPSLSVTQPVIRIAGGTTFDVGTLYEGRVTDRNITIKNTGNDTLTIDNVRTSCGCTVAKLSSRRIAPGGHESLVVSFDSKDLQGKFERYVYITSNDSSHPKLDVTFTGTIVTIVQVTPRYISFGKRRLHSTTRLPVQLKNTTASTIRIRSVVSPDPQIHLSLADSVITPHEAVKLDVTLSPTAKGHLLGQVELTTDSQLKPVIKISYIGDVR